MKVKSGDIKTGKAFKLLWRYLILQKGKIIAGILATFAIGLMELLTGSFLKFLTNTVTRIQGLAGSGEQIKIPVRLNLDIKLFDIKPDIVNTTLRGPEEVMKAIIIISLVFFLLYLFQGIFQYMREVFMNLAIERVLQKFKSDIFRVVMGAPPRLFNNNNTGDVISRVNYDVAVLTDTINILIEISRFVIYMLMFVPVMFIINAHFALFTVLFFPVSFIIIRYVAAVIKKSSRNVSDNVGDYTSFLEERLNRLRFIKVNNSQNIEQAEFDDLVEKNYNYRKKLILQRFFLKPSNEVLGMLVLAVLFIFFSRNLINGSGNIGDVAFFLYLVKTSFKPVKKVARAVGDLNMALISTGKIEELFETEQERLSVSETFPAGSIESVSINNLSFSYNGTAVLKGISMELQKGQITGLTGETGAGKTTLASLLPLLLEPGRKSIFINDFDICDLSPMQVRSKIAFVSGETPLIAGSVYDNVVYGTGAGRSEVEKFRNLLPSVVFDQPGLQIRSDENILTSGEARKIALVRALLRKSDILVLDEAFSFIDDEDIELFIKMIPDDTITLVISKNKVVHKLVDAMYSLSGGSLNRIL